MRIRIVTLAALALCIGLTRSGSADIAPPLPPAQESTAIKIEVDDKATGCKLIVPNGVFTPPRVRPFPKRGAPNEPKGELPQDDGDGIASEAPTQPRNHLLVAGIALTLSLAFGGLWLIRRKSVSTGRTAAVLIAVGASLAATTMVWADLAVPPQPPKFPNPPLKLVQLPVLLDGKVQVEFVYGKEPIRLIIDGETLEKLKKDPKPSEPKSPPKRQ